MKAQNISDLSIDQLKVLAYDATVEYRNAENNLKVINQQIANKLKEKQMEDETPAVEETATETPAEETTAPAEETPAEAPETASEPEPESAE